jgi:protoheme IX farnesyltransferase
MALPTTIAAFEPARVEPYSQRRAVAEYWALTKPEINFLIAIATFAGLYLGLPAQRNGFPFLLLIHTLLGTLLVASGAGALNQYAERRFDAQMRRTRRRPLVANRLDPGSALKFGILLASVGSIYLAVTVNALTSLLAFAALTSYLGLYTPLKRKTPLCTVVGALSGAMAPLIGWAAATDKLSLEAWMLYGILFLWQFPHFMAIAWMYREDYAKAGYRILPNGPQIGRFMSWQALVPSLALMPVSAGAAFFAGSDLLSTGAVCVVTSALIFFSARLALRQSNVAARRLLTISIIYLPVTYLLLMMHRF